MLFAHQTAACFVCTYVTLVGQSVVGMGTHIQLQEESQLVVPDSSITIFD